MQPAQEDQLSLRQLITQDNANDWQHLQNLVQLDEALPELEAARALVKPAAIRTIKKRKPFDTFSPEEQEQFRKKQIVILEVIQVKLAVGGKKLPDNIREDAARTLKVTPQHLGRLWKDYIAYRIAYPEAPGAEVFAKLKPGPEQRSILTEQQEAVFLYAIAVRVRFTKSAIGRYRENVNMPFSILDVHAFAVAAFAQRGERFPSYKACVKYVTRLRNQRPEFYAYLIRGEKDGRRYFEEQLLPKFPNNVDEPNVRWQTDAFDAKVYIEHNGKRYTLSVIIVYDDYSRYVLWWTIIVKEDKLDGSGKVGISARTWSTCLATAMYIHNARPYGLYYDNGVYYVAVENSIALLTEIDEPDIKTTRSEVEEPEGRGKVENAIGKVQPFLDELAGRYRKRRDIKVARNETDPFDLEEIKEEFRTYFTATVNTSVVNKSRKKDNNDLTREEVWSSVIPLAAPPIRKLAQLRNIEYQHKEITFRESYDHALNFMGQEWQLKDNDPDFFRLWARAVEGRTTVQLWAVKLDIGWVAEVLLDAEHNIWAEIVPRGSRGTDVAQYNDTNRAAYLQLREEKKTIEERGAATLEELGGTPVREPARQQYTETGDPKAITQKIKEQRGECKERSKAGAGSDTKPQQPANPKSNLGAAAILERLKGNREDT